jgi:hypothetical protein
LCLFFYIFFVIYWGGCCVFFFFSLFVFLILFVPPPPLGVWLGVGGPNVLIDVHLESTPHPAFGHLLPQGEKGHIALYGCGEAALGPHGKKTPEARPGRFWVVPGSRFGRLSFAFGQFDRG